MKVIMSRSEKVVATVAAVFLLVWFQRTEISDFFNGLRDGYNANQAAHGKR